jgi:predicted nucleic acid binding AN1-type Zn finger protein
MYTVATKGKSHQDSPKLSAISQLPPSLLPQDMLPGPTTKAVASPCPHPSKSHFLNLCFCFGGATSHTPTFTLPCIIPAHRRMLAHYRRLISSQLSLLTFTKKSTNQTTIMAIPTITASVSSVSSTFLPKSRVCLDTVNDFSEIDESCTIKTNRSLSCVFRFQGSG